MKPIIIFTSSDQDRKIECSVCGDSSAPKVIDAFYYFLIGCGYQKDTVEKYINLDKIVDDYLEMGLSGDGHEQHAAGCGGSD